MSSASSLDCSRQRWPPSQVLWLLPPASGHCGRKGDLISFCHSCPSAEKKEHSGLAPCLCTSPGHSIFPSAIPLALPQTQPSALLLSLQGLLDSSRQPSPSAGLCPGPSQGEAGLFVFCHSIAPPCPCLTLLWPPGWSIHWSLWRYLEELTALRVTRGSNHGKPVPGSVRVYDRIQVGSGAPQGHPHHLWMSDFEQRPSRVLDFDRSWGSFLLACGSSQSPASSPLPPLSTLPTHLPLSPSDWKTPKQPRLLSSPTFLEQEEFLSLEGFPACLYTSTPQASRRSHM